MRITAAQRTAFYGNRPYAHLRVEFERRLRTLQQAGEQPDPRDAWITRLKNEITALKHRLTESTSTINELADFQTQALAQLAAQHEEITRLRATVTAASFSAARAHRERSRSLRPQGVAHRQPSAAAHRPRPPTAANRTRRRRPPDTSLGQAHSHVLPWHKRVAIPRHDRHEQCRIR